MKIRNCTKSTVGTGEITMEYAKDVFAELLAFQGYGFCKSHAVAYAVYSAVQLWLEDRYFPEYMCVLLSHIDRSKETKKGESKLDERVSYCIKHGTTVLYSDVQESGDKWKIKSGSALLASLKNIKGLSTRDVEIIEQGRPYADLRDFLDKTSFNAGKFETLLFAHALDCFADSSDKTKQETLYNWYYNDYLESRKSSRKNADSMDLFPELQEGLESATSRTITHFSKRELDERCMDLNGFLIQENILIKYHEYFEEGMRKVAEMTHDESYATGNRTRIYPIAEALGEEIGEDKYRNVWMLAKVKEEVRGIQGKFGTFDKLVIGDGMSTATIMGNAIPSIFHKGSVLVFPVSINDKGKIYIDSRTLDKKDAFVLEDGAN